MPVEPGVGKTSSGPGRDAAVDAGQQQKSLPHKQPTSAGVTFGKLLAGDQYPQAMQLFSRQEDARIREQYRAAVVSHLERLLGAGDYTRAGRLLSAYLQQEYRDVEVLLLRARLAWLQGNFRQAVDTLYEARAYEYLPQRITEINKKIREFVAGFDTQLRETNEDRQRLELYEQLTLLEPDYSPYFIELASAQLDLDRFDEARQSLVLVESDPRVSKDARQLLNRIENTLTFTQPTPMAIPLIRQGEHFIVEAWLNHAFPVRLLIDTGASITVIDHDVLRAAGVSRQARAPVRQFNTAGGMVRGTVYLADALAIGEQSVSNIEIADLEFTHAHSVDGLLGMNYLKHFRFFIDQGEQVLRLSEPLTDITH